MDNPYILFLGILDGLNICNLSLLALFISPTYSAGANRLTVLILGISYIIGVFSSYMLVGLGLLTISLSISTFPHLSKWVSISIMMFVGIANILSYLGLEVLPLNRSSIRRERAIMQMKRIGYGSSLTAGILFGLHNFPYVCTGGVYPTFISMITDAPYPTLLLSTYNILFIAPLAFILYITSTKKIMISIRRWHQMNKDKFKLSLGIVMVSLGLLFLLLTFQVHLK